MQLPCVCENDHVYEGSLVRISGEIRGLSIENVGARPCPVCGGRGKTLDGVYSLRDEVLEILRAPEYTPERLSRVNDAIDEVLTVGRATSSETLSVIERADPALLHQVRAGVQRAANSSIGSALLATAIIEAVKALLI